ncbi:VanZ family protein [Glutamicibacter protophormiae]|uniref:VanZ family protein n=1 Tax=Glutamicibacter protophormiae TaxID=37930 RepID=UPI003A940FD7
MGMARRHWALIALICYTAVAVVLLLAPVSPELIVRAVVGVLHDGLGLAFVRTGHVDAALNVALFVPLGFLMTFVLRPGWLGILVSLALSVSAELAQTLLPARTASLRDILTNAVGAGIGAVVALVVLRRHARRKTRASEPQEGGEHR